MVGMAIGQELLGFTSSGAPGVDVAAMDDFDLAPIASDPAKKSLAKDCIWPTDDATP
jgi:hypothetical protein